MFRCRSIILGITLLFTMQSAQAFHSSCCLVDVNYGVVFALVVEKNAAMISNCGGLLALLSVSVQANTFSGSGYICAPFVTINVKNFLYTGTIWCYSTCVINAEERFDETMFKRAGPGKFIINIEKEATDKCNNEDAVVDSSSLGSFKNLIINFPKRYPVQTVLIGSLCCFACFKYFENYRAIAVL